MDELCDAQGLRWKDAKKKLRPRYGTVWIDIFLRYALIFVVLVSMLTLHQKMESSFEKAILAVFSALALSLIVANLLLFFHEGAHHNLARSRRVNDLLTNIFLAPFVGLEIGHYRKHHWQHHLYLGTEKDTEISYRTPLSIKQLTLELSGIYHVKAALSYLVQKKVATRSEPFGVVNRTVLVSLAAFAAFHLTLSVALWVAVGIFPALSWILGVVFFAPLWNRLRQTLEHRPQILQHPLDATTRSFGNSLLAKAFGAAGFNYHLLHHWDPTISYTRLEEMEHFVLQTQLKDAYLNCTDSYPVVLRKLLS
jgi:fatty acid desaturase